MRFQAQAPFAVSALQAIASGEVAMPHELTALASLQNSFIAKGGLYFHCPTAHHVTSALFANEVPLILTKAVKQRSQHVSNLLGVRHKYFGPTIVVGTTAEIALTEAVFLATNTADIQEILRDSNLSIKQKILYGGFLTASADHVGEGVHAESLWLLRQIAVELGKKKTPGAETTVLAKSLRSYSYGNFEDSQLEQIRTGRLAKPSKDAGKNFPIVHLDLTKQALIDELAGKMKFHRAKDH